MDENLTDQQQAEIVRRWLRENGGFLALGVAVGLGGVWGLGKWQDRQIARAEAASSLYGQLAQAANSASLVEAAELEAQLVAEYGRTPYTDQARLTMAKLHMDRNEPELAAGYLEKLVDSTPDDNMEKIARLRLARVYIQQQRFGDALATLETVDENSAFAGRFHEVRGDAYFELGQLDAAANEYNTAMNSVEVGTVDRALVQAKLNNLHTVEAAADDASAAAE